MTSEPYTVYTERREFMENYICNDFINRAFKGMPTYFKTKMWRMTKDELSSCDDAEVEELFNAAWKKREEKL